MQNQTELLRGAWSLWLEWRKLMRSQSSRLYVPIHVMLESFLAANKSSAAKQLRKGFLNYLTQGYDYFELLEHGLDKLINYNCRVAVLEYGEVEDIRFPLEVFDSRAGECGIHDCEGFYKSNCEIVETKGSYALSVR
jgi:hypothetical protein